MIKQFQELLDSMKNTDEVKVTLDYSDISFILALLKANKVYEEAMTDSLFKGFEKV